MSPPRRSHTHHPQRQRLAQAAARLIAEGGEQEIIRARRKAAAQLGINAPEQIPELDEIEQALRDYQRLFQSHSQPIELQQLRQTALQAMRLFKFFQPHLSGPLVSGIADHHSPIQLHLFADNSETLVIFLLQQQIPFEQDEQTVQTGRNRTEQRIRFRFVAAETPVELTLFPLVGLRQRLFDRDGRALQRLSMTQLERLLEQD